MHNIKLDISFRLRYHMSQRMFGTTLGITITIVFRDVFVLNTKLQ